MALRRQGRTVSAIRQAVQSTLFLRRRPKHGSLKLALLPCIVWLIFHQRLWPSLSLSSDVTPQSASSHQLLLQDKQGNIVSKKGDSLSSFLRSTELSFPTNSAVNVSRSEATRGREPFLAILKDAGVVNSSTPEILALPKWDQVTELYGSKPVILGLETCQEFQRRVPAPDRYIGVAGNFNSGTTAFGISLQANCRYPKRRSGETNRSNQLMTDVDGMLSQVPWAKHKFAQNRTGYTIQPEIPVHHVLPVILVRDPYFWMISMCKQGYGVRWDHNPVRCRPGVVEHFEATARDTQQVG
jgi:hypothetical protein